MRAGLSGDDAPRVTEPPLVARAAGRNYVGAAALKSAGAKSVRLNPRDVTGHSKDWEALLTHTITSLLRADPSDIGCCLPIKSFPKQAELEKLCEVLFEKVGMQAVRLEPEAPLQLMSMGMTTGLVIDAGHANTVVTPVVDGNALSYAMPEAKVAGGAALIELTRAAAQAKWGVRLDDEAVEAALKACYCGVRSSGSGASKLQAPRTASTPSTLTLPDGNKVRIVDDVCMAPSEVLFGGKRGLGADLGATARAAVEVLHRPLQARVWNHVQLVGGVAQMPGYTERATSELSKGTGATVHGSDYKGNATFIGASVKCTLPTTASQGCLSRRTYNERGPSALLTECAPFTNF